jgi:hypothetical protein
LNVLSRHVAATLNATPVSGVADSNRDNIEADFKYGSMDGLVNTVRCSVNNGRGKGHTLERDGFTLSSLPLHRACGADLYDITQCSATLYPLVEEVLRREFPTCSRVFVFDHVLRNMERSTKEIAAGAARTPMLSTGYGHMVHGDYTVRSGFTRLQQLFAPHETGPRIEEVCRQRFAFINVWVPLKPVLSDPLAVLEWDSQRPGDVLTNRLVYEHRVGETYRVLPSAAHRWVYFPEMQPGECLVFKVFDSAEDGRARFSLHSAFDDPTSSKAAPARESIELRCVVLFGDSPDAFGQRFVAPHLHPGSPDRIDDPPLRYEVQPPSHSW